MPLTDTRMLVFDDDWEGGCGKMIQRMQTRRGREMRNRPRVWIEIEMRVVMGDGDVA